MAGCPIALAAVVIFSPFGSTKFCFPCLIPQFWNLDNCILVLARILPSNRNGYAMAKARGVPGYQTYPECAPNNT